MWNRTADPAEDFAAYDADMHKDDGDYPECSACGKPILPGDIYTEIDGEFYHQDCLIFCEMQEGDFYE